MNLLPSFKIAKQTSNPLEWIYVNVILYIFGEPLFPEDFIAINQAGGDRWTFQMRRQLQRLGIFWWLAVVATLVVANVRLYGFIKNKRWGWACMVISLDILAVWLVPHILGYI